MAQTLNLFRINYRRIPDKPKSEELSAENFDVLETKLKRTFLKLFVLDVAIVFLIAFVVFFLW